MLLASSISGGPVSALCLGVASHLALDAIPHGDAGIGHWVHSSPNHVTKLKRLLPMVFLDQILGAGVFFLLLSSPLLASTSFWTLFAGALGSILPDYITGIRDLLPKPPRWLESIHRLHGKCHYRGKEPFTILTGLIFQATLVLLFLGYSFRFF
jgi:hypothetical protein